MLCNISSVNQAALQFLLDSERLNKCITPVMTFLCCRRRIAFEGELAERTPLPWRPARHRQGSRNDGGITRGRGARRGVGVYTDRLRRSVACPEGGGGAELPGGGDAAAGDATVTKSLTGGMRGLVGPRRPRSRVTAERSEVTSNLENTKTLSFLSHLNSLQPDVHANA